jgi:uncharacterized membrane protein YhiD involved in acid resistance
MTLLQFVFRLALALCFGVMIWIERQWGQRMAGLRINTLVPLGAALFISSLFTFATISTNILLHGKHLPMERITGRLTIEQDMTEVSWKIIDQENDLK